MNVELKTLLFVAPFPADKRQALLEIYDKLTADQIQRLTDSAWLVLAGEYFSRIEYEQGKMMLEIEEGKREYNRNDFSDIVSRLTYEFAHRLGASRTAAEIVEVRAMFEKYGE